MEIRSLTALRGVAALWVCVFHYTLNDGPPASAIAKLAQSGFLGVPVFFVLSGFILTHVYRDWFSRLDLKSYRRFMALRLARVYPLHLLTLLIVAWLMMSGVMPVGQNDNPLTFGLNLLLLQSWGFTRSASWNTVSWSVSIELFCYLLFPLMLRVLHGTKWKLPLAIFAAGAGWILNVAYRASFADPSAMQFSYGLIISDNVPIFMTGICVFYLLAATKPGKLLASASFLSGTAWMIYVGIHGDDGSTRLASALLILGLSEDIGIGGALLANPVGKFLGDVSYALYLIHQPLIYVWTFALTHFSGVVWFHMVPLPLRLGVAVIVAAALHYGFERPVRRAVTRWLPAEGQYLIDTDSASSPEVPLAGKKVVVRASLLSHFCRK